jgi:DNA-binding transcriptional LysR family regulator
MTDDVTPLASPAYIRENGPFDAIGELANAKLLKSPLEPWRTWFLAHDVDAPEPAEGSSFNDVGLMCDAAAQGLGIALVRLKLGAPWLENGSLERISQRNVPSPHAHYMCWRTGSMDRWECQAFAEWLQKSLA